MIGRFAVTALFGYALFVSTACADGFLYETSFEEGKGTPEGWASPSRREIWRWEDEGHSGKRCISLVRHREEDPSRWKSELIPLQPRRAYRMSLWYKVENEDKERGVVFLCNMVTAIFPYSEKWRKKSIVFYLPPNLNGVRLSFEPAEPKGARNKIFIDDVSITSLGVKYHHENGLVLDQFERIENGTYVFDWNFKKSTDNICRVVEKDTTQTYTARIRFYNSNELVLKFGLGQYKQLSGRVTMRLSHYKAGEGILSVSRDAKTWTEIGRIGDGLDIGALKPEKDLDFELPKKYPSTSL